MATDKKPGNSGAIGMKGNSIEEAAKNVLTPDSSEFFSALEDQVNGSIVDKNTDLNLQLAPERWQRGLAAPLLKSDIKIVVVKL